MDRRAPVDDAFVREDRLESDEVVSAQDEPQKHDLPADVKAPIPVSPFIRGHDLETGTQVPTPDSLPFSTSSSPFKGHYLGSYIRVPTPEPLPAPRHSLSKDRRTPSPAMKGATHHLESDIHMPTPERIPVHGHRLSNDRRTPSPAPRGARHDLGSDIRVKTPELLAAHGHMLSNDRRTPSPAPRGTIHDLGSDIRVPTPELLAAHRLSKQWRNREPRLLRTPSPRFERHDLNSPAAANPARQHSILLDKRVAQPADNTREHSINDDNLVSERVHQLLERFLEQDRRSVGRSSSGRSVGLMEAYWKRRLPLETVIVIEEFL
ncbi:hypothetical protein B0H66DRAFT_551292 [Apodospora peruviana]|uniref:Uncharacterized protein n=1 Tax=Apodospora peruviana TaxID=516989 RepID=A0AAE0IK13_9PEZI|nr:hypothetical protein B0H66DRAFT_551292 [Apodospora peruviana]